MCDRDMFDGKPLSASGVRKLTDHLPPIRRLFRHRWKYSSISPPPPPIVLINHRKCVPAHPAKISAPSSSSRDLHRTSLSIMGTVTLVTLIVAQLITEIESIRVVSLNVPSHVHKGSDLELSCLFDLGNATLYSLKWFYRPYEWNRDEQEFFRYTPRLKPYKQLFPIDGIHVDLSKSSGGIVYIREANGRTSGKYKCEISVEGTFQTVAAEKLMTVLSSNGSKPNTVLWLILSAALITSFF